MENLFMFIVGYLIPVGIITGMLYADGTGRFRTRSLLQQKEDLGVSLCYGMMLGILSYLGVFIAYLVTAMAHHGWVIPGVNTPWLKNIK